MKKLLVLLVAFAIGTTLVNDIGHYAVSRYHLSVKTDEIAQSAARAAGRGKAAAGQAAVAAAAERGVTLYGFDHDSDGVHVWTQAPVEGTWAYSRFMAWRAKKPIDTPHLLWMDRTALAQ